MREGSSRDKSRRLTARLVTLCGLALALLGLVMVPLWLGPAGAVLGIVGWRLGDPWAKWVVVAGITAPLIGAMLDSMADSYPSAFHAPEHNVGVRILCAHPASLRPEDILRLPKWVTVLVWSCVGLAVGFTVDRLLGDPWLLIVTLGVPRSYGGANVMLDEKNEVRMLVCRHGLTVA